MKNFKINLNFILIICLIIIAVGLRFLPHAPNFAPIGALALFGGAYLKKHWSYTLPIAAMIISDSLIGFYTPLVMAAVYISFIISVFLGSLARNRKNIGKIIFLTLSGSVIFFLVTNFAVWALTPMYDKTIAGLTDCYLAALPFFRNTILSDLFYAGILFGGYEIISFIVIPAILITPPRCEEKGVTSGVQNLKRESR